MNPTDRPRSDPDEQPEAPPEPPEEPLIPGEWNPGYEVPEDPEGDIPWEDGEDAATASVASRKDDP